MVGERGFIEELFNFAGFKGGLLDFFEDDSGAGGFPKRNEDKLTGL